MSTSASASSGGASPGPSENATRWPARLPLTGADGFLRAFDGETRRRNGASHLAQVVLRLGPGFDADAFRAMLSETTAANPILRAPIRRVLGLGPPGYRLGAGDPAWPRFTLHPAPTEPAAWPALPALFHERLNEVRSSRRGELLRVDAVPRGGERPGTDVALTWLHMLFDGAGSERFVSFLEQRRRGLAPPVPPADRPESPPEVALPALARERGAMAMRWQRHMQGLGAVPTRSLAGPESGLRQDLVYDVHGFAEEASADILGRAASQAGFLTPMLFYVAAAIRAHDAVLRARGSVPESYVVPLPVDLRPKGGEGGVFRTRVSMIWLQVRAERVREMASLLEDLKAVRREAIRDRQVENGVAAMSYALHAPARLYARMTRRTLQGELCSFFFGWTAAFCDGLDRFFGAELIDGFHAPSVPASPGSGLVFSLFGERLNVTHVRQRGVVSETELAVFQDSLRRDLTGAG
ncbi:MAG: hypothetical protein ABFS41_15955 [Myxococcota bacterium]